MAREAPTIYVCESCGRQSRKWLGKCPDCGEWSSFVEQHAVTGSRHKSSGLFTRVHSSPVLYSEIESQEDIRVSSGVPEFDRVLGGGIVPGSLVLIGGDPGIGKSTLLLQVASCLSARGTKVLYVSGEESEQQIKMRGERLGIGAPELYILPETNLEIILSSAVNLSPGTIIIDSIQTVFSSALESAPGSVAQVREVATQFLNLAKGQSLTIFLIGHITKDGSLAGPKTLEHIVDTVLYFEGERHQYHRIVRATKNRFGAAHELGIFEMTGAGLIGVANPSQLFLQERPVNVTGSVVSACIQGTRPVLVEVQALVSGPKASGGRPVGQGYDANRIALLLAMLEKRTGYQLLGSDVFVKVAGGLVVDEPAADLGVVAAIASSYRNIPLDYRTAVFGEVGLTGEVRPAMQAAIRIREAQALGFEKIIMPLANAAGFEGQASVNCVGVRSVEDVLEDLFSSDF